ncbi:MAG TPA: hypothetical protein VFC19_45375 [Candidatus Limnocylindrales bacterium]|nr:hypothetical protein [Candidatus Limnocylindrales bacterium]
MTIPQPQNPDMGEHLDFVVMSPPNDNTDGRDCVCGHAAADHHQVKGPDGSQSSWQCQYCSCTQAFPARVASTQ